MKSQLGNMRRRWRLGISRSSIWWTSITWMAVLCWMPACAPAGVKQSVLAVDLVNPGTSISQITFNISGMGLLLSTLQNTATVKSPAGQPNRFATSSDNATAVVFANIPQIEGGAYSITLNPLQTFKANQNIQFVMTIPDVTGITIGTTATTNGVATYGGPPQWFNNATPPALVKPGPKFPGFKVVTKDADYTVYNDPGDPFEIDNLQILPNITMDQFNALDLDSIIAQTPTPALDLSATDASADFPNEPDPDPGNLFIAEGQLLDTSGDVIGAFAEGVQTEPVPEPGLAGVLVVGLAMMGRRRGRR
jgi:hypothetical protein